MKLGVVVAWVLSSKMARVLMQQSFLRARADTTPNREEKQLCRGINTRPTQHNGTAAVGLSGMHRDLPSPGRRGRGLCRAARRDGGRGRSRSGAQALCSDEVNHARLGRCGHDALQRAAYLNTTRVGGKWAAKQEAKGEREWLSSGQRQHGDSNRAENGAHRHTSAEWGTHRVGHADL